MKKGSCLWSSTSFIKPLIACSIDIAFLKFNVVMFCTVRESLTFGEVFIFSWSGVLFLLLDSACEGLIFFSWNGDHMQSSQQHWGWLTYSSSKIFCTNPAVKATRCWHSGNAAMGGNIKLFGWYTPWRYCYIINNAVQIIPPVFLQHSGANNV